MSICKVVVKIQWLNIYQGVYNKLTQGKHIHILLLLISQYKECSSENFENKKSVPKILWEILFGVLHFVCCISFEFDAPNVNLFLNYRQWKAVKIKLHLIVICISLNSKDFYTYYLTVSVCHIDFFFQKNSLTFFFLTHAVSWVESFLNEQICTNIIMK